MRVPFQEALAAMGGTVVSGTPADLLAITSVSTDSRSITPGDCFFALKGEQFDAHDFLGNAVETGARILVVERAASDLPEHVVQVEVSDTLEALGHLANYWRHQFPRLPIVALAGSSGKTTTKEMAAEIVSSTRPTLSTKGNLNNLIGLPQMLFQLDEVHEAAILEIGMNVPDENRRLVQMADPDCLLLTNINHAHIGMFASLDAHFDAETEALKYASARCQFIFNLDDEKSMRARELYGFGHPGKTFGMVPEADITATGIVPIQPYGYQFNLLVKGFHPEPVTLRVFGRHNVSNALAAAAVARFFDVAPAVIAERLSQFQPRLNRSEVENIEGWYLIKDYYNAIPAAVELALDSLQDFQVPGRRYALLGDMLELGEFENQFHREVGEAASRAGLHKLFTLGERGRMINAAAAENGTVTEHLPSLEVAAERLKQELTAGDLLLLKGSRLLKLENLHRLLKT